MQQSEQELTQRKAVRDFLYHFIVYVFVVAILVIVDVQGGTAGDAILGLDWAYWVALAWGLGLAGHAVYAFMGEHGSADATESG